MWRLYCRAVEHLRFRIKGLRYFTGDDEIFVGTLLYREFRCSVALPVHGGQVIVDLAVYRVGKHRIIFSEHYVDGFRLDIFQCRVGEEEYVEFVANLKPRHGKFLPVGIVLFLLLRQNHEIIGGHFDNFSVRFYDADSEHIFTFIFLLEKPVA